MGFTLSFPAKRKRFPRFKKQHSTRESAEREANRVLKLLPYWGEPLIHPHISEQNPIRKVTGGRAISLKNFTGTITRKNNGAVVIRGRQK